MTSGNMTAERDKQTLESQRNTKGDKESPLVCVIARRVAIRRASVAQRAMCGAGGIGKGMSVATFQPSGVFTHSSTIRNRRAAAAWPP